LSLPIVLLKKIFPEVKKLGFKKIAFTGGEPALNPEFNEIVKLVVDFGFCFTIVSNGSLLNKYSFIVDYPKNIKWMVFSLEGVDAEQHDNNRHKGAFNKVIESLYYFNSKHVPTSISYCITRANKDSLVSLFELVKKIGLQNLTLTTTIKTEFNNDLVLNDDEKAKSLKEILSLIKRYKKYFDVFVGPAFPLRNKYHFCKVLADLNTISINPDGNFIFCCDLTKGGYSLGSLYEYSFNELYKKYCQLAKDLYLIRKKIYYTHNNYEGFKTCEFCNMIFDKKDSR
jgi:MoaA/NifB/PqqE/SkfB family radical SAM enzyme